MEASSFQYFADGPIDEAGPAGRNQQAADDNVEKRPAMTSADGQLHRYALPAASQFL